MRRAGRWPWPLETVSLHDPRAAPLPAAGGPAAFPFGRNGGSRACFQWRGRRELVFSPSVTPCTGEASRRLRSCRCCPGRPADAPQAPSGHPRYPQTPHRYPTETTDICRQCHSNSARHSQWHNIYPTLKLATVIHINLTTI